MSEKDKVVTLRPASKRSEAEVAASKVEINKALVEHLSHALQLAKAGQLKSYAAAMVNPDDSITTLLECNEQRFAISHAVGALWWRFHNAMNNEAS